MTHSSRTPTMLPASRPAWVIAALVATAVVGISAQQPPAPTVPVPSILVASGTGAIFGTVRSSGPDPAPIRRARVWIGRTQSELRQATITDDQGRFGFTGLAPGRFLITADKPPYLDGQAGARTPGGPGVPVALSDAQVMRDVVVELAPGAVIAGRIVDAHGAPAAGSRVSLATRRMVDGEVVIDNVASTTTDDRGEYRFYGRRPGRYVVTAMPPVAGAGRVPTAAELQWARRAREMTGGIAAGSAPPVGPSQTYVRVAYPGVTDMANATEVIVETGSERVDVNFALQFVTAGSVAGRVLLPDGQPAADALVTLSPQVRQVRADAEGRFSITGLPPQAYAVTATGTAGPAPTFARAAFVVGGSDPVDVTLTLQPGGTVSGRIMAEPSREGPRIDLTRVSLRLAPTGLAARGPGALLSRPPGAIEDGSFTFHGVPPGSYRLIVSLASTPDESDRWTVRSAAMAGRDVLETPFDVLPEGVVGGLVVTLTDRVTELDGTLVDQLGLPAPELFVAVFPVEPGYWHEGSRRMVAPVHPDNAGRFLLSGLPAGDYYLAVVNDLSDEWHTAAYLEQVIPGAIRVTLREGVKVTQDIKLAQ